VSGREGARSEGPPAPPAAAAVRIGAASRPYPGEEVNGDGWAVGWDGDACRIAVVDGLGHGPAAAVAARAALAALAARPALGPADAVRACHAALAGTRGAAVAVARIEPAGRRLTFAGVGNVEGRLWPVGPAGRAERPIAYRGIVGAALPTVRAFEFALGAGWLLVLHTDGVSARFELDQVPEGARGHPQALAEAVLARWGRSTDDATVVAATEPRGT
jgi:serine phosphatase RsbU (regulator of sigma subunit)